MTNKKLFGTSGIRGKIGSEINSELALKIGKSSEIYHKAKKIYPLKRVEIIKSKVLE